jgi:hypothetical protein
MGRAKSYAERLFDFPEIGPLSPEAAKRAIAKPANNLGVDVTLEALECIVSETRAYPYFVQECGKHAWDTAHASPITREDVMNASASAVAALACEITPGEITPGVITSKGARVPCIPFQPYFLIEVEQRISPKDLALCGRRGCGNGTAAASSRSSRPVSATPSQQGSRGGRREADGRRRGAPRQVRATATPGPEAEITPGVIIRPLW